MGTTLCSLVAAFPENCDFCTHRIDFPGTNSGMMVGWASPTSNPLVLEPMHSNLGCSTIWSLLISDIYVILEDAPLLLQDLILSLYFKGFIKRLFRWFILLSVYLIESVYTLFKCPLFHLLCYKLVLKRALIFLSAGKSFRQTSNPSGSDGKGSTCNVGDLGLIPGLGRSPGEGKGYPFQYSGLENSMDRGAWRDTWGCKELDMTERLLLYFTSRP